MGQNTEAWHPACALVLWTSSLGSPLSSVFFGSPPSTSFSVLHFPPYFSPCHPLDADPRIHQLCMSPAFPHLTPPLSLERQELRATGLGCPGDGALGPQPPPPPHIHTCLRPQPPPQGPHLARVLSFLGCKLPPAAPWHLLRFRFHEPFSLGGFREGWRSSIFPSFVCLRLQREILGNIVSDSSVQVLGELWFLAGG